MTDAPKPSISLAPSTRRLIAEAEKLMESGQGEECLRMLREEIEAREGGRPAELAALNGAAARAASRLGRKEEAARLAAAALAQGEEYAPPGMQELLAAPEPLPQEQAASVAMPSDFREAFDLARKGTVAPVMRFVEEFLGQCSADTPSSLKGKYYCCAALAHFHAGNYEQCIQWLQRNDREKVSTEVNIPLSLAFSISEKTGVDHFTPLFQRLKEYAEKDQCPALLRIGTAHDILTGREVSGHTPHQVVQELQRLVKGHDTKDMAERALARWFDLHPEMRPDARKEALIATAQQFLSRCEWFIRDDPAQALTQIESTIGEMDPLEGTSYMESLHRWAALAALRTDRPQEALAHIDKVLEGPCNQVGVPFLSVLHECAIRTGSNEFTSRVRRFLDNGQLEPASRMHIEAMQTVHSILTGENAAGMEAEQAMRHLTHAFNVSELKPYAEAAIEKWNEAQAGHAGMQIIIQKPKKKAASYASLKEIRAMITRGYYQKALDNVEGKLSQRKDLEPGELATCYHFGAEAGLRLLQPEKAASYLRFYAGLRHENVSHEALQVLYETAECSDRELFKSLTGQMLQSQTLTPRSRDQVESLRIVWSVLHGEDVSAIPLQRKKDAVSCIKAISPLHQYAYAAQEAAPELASGKRKSSASFPPPPAAAIPDQTLLPNITSFVSEGKYAEALALIEPELAESSVSPQHAAQLSMQAAVACWKLGRMEEMLRHIEMSLTDHQPLRVCHLAMLHDYSNYCGRDELTRIVEQAKRNHQASAAVSRLAGSLRIARAIIAGDPPSSMIRGEPASSFSDLAEHSELLPVVTEARARWKEISDPRDAVRQAKELLDSNGNEAARELLEKEISAAGATGHPYYLQMLQTQAALANLRCGRNEEALAHVSAVIHSDKPEYSPVLWMVLHEYSERTKNDVFTPLTEQVLARPETGVLARQQIESMRLVRIILKGEAIPDIPNEPEKAFAVLSTTKELQPYGVEAQRRWRESPLRKAAGGVEKMKQTTGPSLQELLQAGHIAEARAVLTARGNERPDQRRQYEIAAGLMAGEALPALKIAEMHRLQSAFMEYEPPLPSLIAKASDQWVQSSDADALVFMQSAVAYANSGNIERAMTRALSGYAQPQNPHSRKAAACLDARLDKQAAQGACTNERLGQFYLRAAQYSCERAQQSHLHHRAQHYLRRHLADHPHDGQAIVSLILSALTNHDTEVVFTAANALLEVNSDNAFARFARASASTYIGNFPSAIQDLQHVLHAQFYAPAMDLFRDLAQHGIGQIPYRYTLGVMHNELLDTDPLLSEAVLNSYNVPLPDKVVNPEHMAPGASREADRELGEKTFGRYARSGFFSRSDCVVRPGPVDRVAGMVSGVKRGVGSTAK